MIEQFSPNQNIETNPSTSESIDVIQKKLEEKNKIEIPFKILRPGDERVTESLTGEPLRTVIAPNERAITLGETSGISLEDYKDYFFIDGIRVDESLQGKGIGHALYDKALELAKQEGKKGLISSKKKRNAASDRFWERYRKEGRAGTIVIDGDEYDVLYPPQ